jgi:hypothetical protein
VWVWVWVCVGVGVGVGVCARARALSSRAATLTLGFEELKSPIALTKPRVAEAFQTGCPRWQGENLAKNKTLVSKVEALAAAKGVTAGLVRRVSSQD